MEATHSSWLHVRVLQTQGQSCPRLWISLLPRHPPATHGQATGRHDSPPAPKVMYRDIWGCHAQPGGQRRDMAVHRASLQQLVMGFKPAQPRAGLGSIRDRACLSRAVGKEVERAAGQAQVCPASPIRGCSCRRLIDMPGTAEARGGAGTAARHRALPDSAMQGAERGQRGTGHPP